MSVGTSVGTISLLLSLNSASFSKGLSNVTKQANTASSKITTSLAKIGAVVASVFSVSKIVSWGKTCVEVATETSNAWIGLNSILTGQGKSFSNAQAFIEEYVSDGLVPLNNAVTAYKNLALRGYSSDQIEKTMNALKNSATFARQSTYTLGEAVQTATEGLKNENSVVVDNAGVTKNVAKMWEDYAKSIGKTTDSLTQAEKIQAEVNGILEETKFQSNDAAIYSETYSGKVAQLNTALTTLKTTIGECVQPIAKLFIPAIQSAITYVNSLFTSLKNLLALFGYEADSVSNVSSDVDDLTSALEDTEEASTSASKSLASFDTAQVLSSSSSDDSSVDTEDAEEVLETVTETSSVMDEISQKLYNFFKPLADSWKTYGGNLITKVKETASAIGGVISSVWGSVSKLITNGTVYKMLGVILDRIKLIATAFSNAWNYNGNGDAIVQNLATAFINLQTAINNVLASDKFQEFLYYCSDKLREISEKIASINWQPMIDALFDIGETVGKIALNILSLLVDVFKWLIEHPNVAITLVAIGTGFKVIVSAIKGLSTLGTIAKGIKDLGEAIGGLSKITTILKTLSGVVLIIAGIATAITSFISMLKDGFSWAKEFFMVIGIGIAAVGAVILGVPAGIAAAVAAVVAIIATIIVVVKEHWDQICEFIANIGIALAEWFMGVIQSIVDFFTNIWNTVTGWIDSLKQAWNDFWQEMFLIIANIVTTIYDTVKGWIDNLKQAWTEFWNNIFSKVSEIWTNIKTAVSNAINGVKENISNVLNSIKSVWDKIWNGFKTTVTNVFTGIWNAIKGVINSILGGIESMANGVVKGVNTIIKALNNLSFTVPDWVPLLGGKEFGFNIPTLNEVSLPRLATGAYVKANTPQLAVIGDNKTQGEYVAPEDKLRDLIREESGSGDNSEIIALLEKIIAILNALDLSFSIDGYELNKRLEKVKSKTVFATNGG